MKKMIPLFAVITMFAACQKASAPAPVTDKSSTAALASDINDPGKIPSILIRGQRWMAANLSVSFYRNGDKIPQVTNKDHWDRLTTGAWCWYKNDSATYAAYGKLYNWYAVHDPRGLAPTDWHVPTDAEWDSLRADIGSNAGGRLKSTGTIEDGTGLWYAPNRRATDQFGFTGLPGGRRLGDGTFSDLGYYAYWWSSTHLASNNAWNRDLSNSFGYFFRSLSPKQSGFSVRCLRDD